MAEYIERELARFEAKRYFKNLDEIQEDLDMIFCMLPAEDVAPVRHGRWNFIGSDRWNDAFECSECGKMNIGDSDYCPNCGAKMDGGASDGTESV